VMTVFSSGISMYAMARLIQILHIFDGVFAAMSIPQGYIFHFSIVVSALIVLGYIFLGGLTSAIYNEVLQFFLIVAGFVPLVYLGLKNLGGWQGMMAKLPESFGHSWTGMGSASTNPLGVEVFGLAMGLGFVLSFGYWCTDFLVVQRAMAADSMDAAQRTPLIAAVPKMFFPFLVIVPGLIAVALPDQKAPTGMVYEQTVGHEEPVGKGIIPPKMNAETGMAVVDQNGHVELDYDLAIPNLLLHYFPNGLLGLGLIALLASFMSGMAGNVTAFNTVFTYDIYQSYIKKDATDEHLLHVGRVATVGGIVLSLFAAFVATRFNNIMDMLQLVFAFVNAPLFATFLLGMFWKRATGHGAFFGLLSGTVAAAVHHGLSLPAGAAVGFKGGWLGAIHTYPSEMAQSFWTAIFAWCTCFFVTILVSLATKPPAEDQLKGLVYSLTEKPAHHHLPLWKRPHVFAIAVLALTLVLNVVFW
jgi:SSS family solute:Na+ symporter